MNKIQRISTYLLIVFNLLIFTIPLIPILKWGFSNPGTNEMLWDRMTQTPEGYVNLNAIHWTGLSKMVGLSSDLLGILPFYLSLFVLAALFRNYKNGNILSSENALHYRKLGWLFFFNALFVQSLSDTLMTLAVTLNNPHGHRYLTVSVGTPNMISLFCGLLVIVISWVMLEAGKLFNEQQFTI